MGVLRQAKFVDQNKGGPKIGQILTKCDVGPKACRIGKKM